MNKKQAIVLGVVLLVVAGIIIGFKVATSPSRMPQHITVAQARADTSGQPVKVGGDVVPGSVGWNNATQSLSFSLTAEGERMQVVYNGPAPGDFKPGTALIVEGMFDRSGVFQATSLTSRNSPLCRACH